MHNEELHPWQHTHTFGQDRRRPGERRTLIVIALTGVMMVVEIFAGMVLGSMALLADGLHMASHVVALGVSALAYVYARRHAHDSAFSFGTGKVNTLGGFTGAVLLAVFAALMGWESLARFVQPTVIVFDQAILVAILGLIVNGISALILGMGQLPEDGDHAHGHDHGPAHPHHDHNLESAYLHVLADAATSVLAIIALLAGKYLGLLWMDPAMGLVGALLVARWAVGLLRTTSSILLDRQGPETLSHSIRQGIEIDRDSQVTDLHLWSIGPDLYAVILTIVAQEPRSPGEYRARIAQHPELAHISLEIHRRPVTRATMGARLAQSERPA